jgi:hypothetical protein
MLRHRLRNTGSNSIFATSSDVPDTFLTGTDLSCAVADDPLAGFASAADAYPTIDKVIATTAPQSAADGVSETST